MLRVCLALVAAVTGIGFAGIAQAQDYPSRVVRVVNPYVAGSTTDRLARALAVGLASRLGREFVVENRAGAGGATGTLAVVRSDTDGHTLLFAPALVLSVHPQARNDAGYRTDALVPICQTFVNAMVLAVLSIHDQKRCRSDGRGQGEAGCDEIWPSRPAHHSASCDGGIAARQQDRHQGHSLSRRAAGGDGSARRPDRRRVAVLGTISGRQDLHPLGIFSETRHSSFPDVPTVKEQGTT